MLVIVVYKRRLSKSRGPKVSYRKVDVLKADEGRTGKIRAVVTGGSGSIGSAVVTCLIEDGGYEVHSLDLAIPEEEDRDPRVSSYVQTDVTSLDDLEIAFKGAEVVFHAASAFSDLRTSDSAVRHTNVTGTERVIAACKLCGVKRLIYTSSSLAVLRDGRCVSDPDGDKDTPPNTERPANAYAASKALAEGMVCAANGVGGLATCALRTAMVLGAKDRASSACLRQRMFYCGAGNECMQLAPVGASAQAHLLAEKQLLRDGERAIAAGRAYFICGIRVPLRDLFGNRDGEATLWGQPTPKSYPKWQAQLLARLNVAAYSVLGVCPLGPDFTPMWFSSMVDHSCDGSLAYKELGWKMDFPVWMDMVREVVREYRGLKEGKKDV